MKSIDINISILQKFIHLLRNITISKEKISENAETGAAGQQLFPNEESITAFHRKAYLGNFMAGPYAMIDPRFFKSKEPHFQNN